MISSTISETKNRLSELLRRVQGGETLIILDRNRPIARVEAVVGLDHLTHVTPPKDPGALQRMLQIPLGGGPDRATGALAALLEERESGR